MKTQALQYYMHDGPTAFRFELSGELDRESATRLQQDWHTASSVIGGRTLIVDLTFVTGADEAGADLLARWHGSGARLIAASKVSRELAESIIGEPLADDSAAVAERTWLPLRSFFEGGSPRRAAAAIVPAMRERFRLRLPQWPLALTSHRLLLALALLLPIPMEGASLKPETAAAFETYVQSAGVVLDGNFLRIYNEPENMAKVRSGEIVASPLSGQNPKKVPGGLIHHWRGNAFVQDAKLEEVLGVVRDYDHYRDYYSPSVVDSHVIARNGSDDQFSMMLMNKAFLVKTAFDADYKSTNVRMGPNRFYSVSHTTRLQEVQAVGESGERRMPEGEGGGYIWKLFSITRLEQRDGGVYVEMETVALSREIPAALHLIVDPIVRRASRSSMTTSLQQTAEAVRVLTARVESNSGVMRKASAFVRVR